MSTHNNLPPLIHAFRQMHISSHDISHIVRAVIALRRQWASEENQRIAQIMATLSPDLVGRVVQEQNLEELLWHSRKHCSTTSIHV